jgi:hypothetical protein
MSKASPRASSRLHTLYIRKFPADLTRRVKLAAVAHECTISQALARILTGEIELPKLTP